MLQILLVSPEYKWLPPCFIGLFTKGVLLTFKEIKLRLIEIMSTAVFRKVTVLRFIYGTDLLFCQFIENNTAQHESIDEVNNLKRKEIRDLCLQ